MAAIETGCPFWIYNPGLTDFVSLNQPSDSKFVGYITDITGIDDAGVRENAQVQVAGDGGYHGPFWRDRRPWTVSGIIMPTLPVLARDQAQERLEYIVGQAFRSDGTMVWLPADGIYKALDFRKQQPVRIAKGQSNIEKTFQIACVTEDFRVRSYGSTTISGSGPCPITVVTTGLGNAFAPAVFTVTGPIGPRFGVVNVTTGKQIVSNQAIAAGDFLTISTIGRYPTITSSIGTSLYGTIDPLVTDWSTAVGPGANSWQLVDTGGTSTGATAISIRWFDTWL